MLMACGRSSRGSRGHAHGVLIILCAALASAAGQADAQPRQSPASNAPDTDELQEIIVTAEKREESIQKVPVSITAVSGEALEAQGITDVLQLAQETPGISFRSAGPGQTEFEMRGLTSAGGSSATVGFYFDDIPISPPAIGSIGKVTIDPDLFDLNRVEVLRGPQGTLYGAGSMGGTIKLITSQPDLHQFSGTAQAFASDTTGGGVNGGGDLMLNLPLGGGIAAVRLDATDKYIAGWIDRTYLNPFPFPTNTGCKPTIFYGCARGDVLTAHVAANYQDVNWERLQNFRASVRLQPNDALNIVVHGMYQHMDMGGYSQFDIPPGSDYLTHYQAANYPEPFWDRMTLFGATITYDWPGVQLTSDTGYWSRNMSQIVGQSEAFQTIYFLPDFIADNYNFEADVLRQTSQEFRLASTTDAPFQWLAGVFFSHLGSTWIQRSFSEELAGFSLGGAAANPLGNVYTADTQYTLNQWSVFAEANYQVTAHNKVTLGLRLFDYDSNLSADQAGLFAESVNATHVFAQVSANDRGSNPRLNWSYTPTDNLLLYATLAKGFRPGGVNLPLPDKGPNSCLPAFENLGLKQAQTSYRPDSVWNLEAGEKAKLNDGKIIVNGAIYYIRWYDVQQLLPLSCGWFFTSNVGTARSYGPEIEVTARVLPSLTVAVNGTYTEAELTSANAHTNLQPGAPILNIPKYTATASLAYDRPLTGSYSVDARIWETFTGPLEDAAYTYMGLPAYRLAYFRTGVTSEKWDIFAFVDNLTNRQAILTVNNTEWGVNIPSLTRATTNQPRTAGLKLTYRF